MLCESREQKKSRVVVNFFRQRFQMQFQMLKVKQKQAKGWIAAIEAELQAAKEEVRTTKEDCERKVKCTETKWKDAFLNFKNKNEEELKKN